jgi:Domain of unknown function (DUF3291)
MAFLSVTRLRLRSAYHLPMFFVHVWKTRAQLQGAEGFIQGALLNDRERTFWTMTLWREQGDMQRYMTQGAHGKVMPKLALWCDEASVVHWNMDSLVLPDWHEADRRMRAEGRSSRLPKPSRHHADLSYAPPRTTLTLPIKSK